MHHAPRLADVIGSVRGLRAETTTAATGFTILANLAHGVSRVPVDDAFAPQAWQPAGR